MKVNQDDKQFSETMRVSVGLASGDALSPAHGFRPYVSSPYFIANIFLAIRTKTFHFLCTFV